MSDDRVGLANLRVLVLEDEMLVALLVEDMIAEFGCVVVGPAASVADAIALVEAEAIGAALLDLNLSDGGSGYAVADALAARGVPFAFVTGYGRAALREPYRDRPILQKPFQMDALGAMLAALAAGR
ncbi:MAG: response regulator [Acetobacteraceae bacterium]